MHSGGIQKYDATGLVPHYSDSSQVPEHLQKYFAQRKRLFTLYDEPPGCLLDEEGWYSVTPELIADQIAERCRCDTILDPFCGVGGNAIAFAKTCQRVVALDTSPIRLALARHNAEIYGVADRIEFIHCDYLSFARSYLQHNPEDVPSPTTSSDPARPASPNHTTRKIDVIFLSPPWGGPSYLSSPIKKGSAGEDLQEDAGEDSHPIYTLNSIQPIPGADLFQLTRKITRNVAFFLPRNTSLEEISKLLPSGLQTSTKVEVEEEWMGSKLKALTCYFGGLVDGQEHLY
ncbi:S-adenosyl-L-methionine-dependent methyltransferase [Pluteus cervinus]|uniref:S-adenosyl-L-methionine-dependent methyltransferase n=1 Tax=Pluteus cervinus TaxID=181527 RepID=A0ACD3AGZ3_9AGAR|nr:S-adenosyl-L-methionine-dependent methyltransferase [Pluteus cervinus]